MQQVIENPNTNTPLKIDAHLYAGMALEKMGKSGRSHFESAIELNPFARRAAEYLLMGAISALARNDDPLHLTEDAKNSVNRLKEAKNKYARLFPEDSELMESIIQITQ